MKKQNLLAAALAGALASTTASLAAQDGTNTVETVKLAAEPEGPPYRPWTIGLGAGTDGIFGGGVSWRFSDHLGTRVGIAYADASWNHLGTAGINYDAKLRLLSEPLTLDVYPWLKSSFHVSLGVLFNQNELTGSASDGGAIGINGQVSLKIQQLPVNPYLSIGGNFFYFDHAHHWALGGELGVAYTGRADVSLNGSIGSRIEFDNESHRLQRYADQLEFWPMAKLFVSYSF
jgi:hypothetical protein